MSEWPGRLVLLGHPVGHSLSPTFQNAALRTAAIPLRYEALDVPPSSLDATLRALADERAAGNVTVPHKEAVARRCASLSPLARRVGAVNSFRFEGGDLLGDNTDVGGFEAAVRALLGDLPRDAQLAVLGAGGAAAAVLAAVERWSGARVRLWNRTRARADALAARFGDVARVEETLAATVRGAGIVINATSVGLAGEDHPVALDLLANDVALIDLVYRRGGTPWVRAARAAGIPATDGLPMLVEQGALAFEAWFGFAPDRGAMWASLD
jgi:shikimate dehydrogenase